MLDRKKSNVSKSSEVVDLTQNLDIHYPGLNNFDFAFVISDNFGEVFELDSSLYTVKINQTIITRNEDSSVSFNNIEIPYRRCTTEDFSISNKKLKERVTNTFMYCPEYKNFSLSGSFASDAIHCN